MAQITAADKALIKSVMREKGWSSVLKFLGLKIEQWQAQPITGQSAYEELKGLHLRDGKVAGVTELFDQMEKQAFDV